MDSAFFFYHDLQQKYHNNIIPILCPSCSESSLAPLGWIFRLHCLGNEPVLKDRMQESGGNQAYCSLNSHNNLTECKLTSDLIMWKPLVSRTIFTLFAFDRFDPRLDGQEAERKFMWKSATPYVSFFIVLLVTVAVLPLCDKQWIPCSEMSLVALFFTGNVFVNIHLLQQNFTS